MKNTYFLLTMLKQNPNLSATTPLFRPNLYPVLSYRFLLWLKSSRIGLIAGLTCFIIWSFTANAYAVLTPNSKTNALEKIAAVVNDEIILQSELAVKVSLEKQALQQRNQLIPSEDKLQQQVLEKMIEENLQLQVATENGIQVSDAMLNQAIDNVAQQNNMSIPQLYQAIRSSGNTVANYRANARRQITLSEIGKVKLNQRIRVSEKEIDRFLISRQGQALGNRNKEVLLANILVAVPQSADANALAQAEAKLAKIQQGLDKGEDFAKLAQQYSDAGNANKGGALGWRKVNEIPALFAPTINKLPNGAVTPVIRNESGFHIAKRVDERNQKQRLVAQIKLQHILIRPNAIRDTKASSTLVNDIYAKLQQGTSFSQLAGSFSDDHNTSWQGGDMDWQDIKQLPQAMQNVVSSLPIGELSVPFATPEGWHILKVKEKRDKDVGNLILRNQAKQILFNTKLEDEYTNWKQELYQRAYIDIRL